MPARARKRKPKRRKSSSRKKARRRRPTSRPRVNPPSSDEDFVLDGDGDESSSGSTDQEDNEDDEDTEEEEEEEEEEESEESEEADENYRNEVRNSDANLGFSSRRRRQPTRARNGFVNATSLSDGTGGHVNRTTRVRRRHRRQDSSDEDFDVDLERILEDSLIANAGVVASRPMTRAMDVCQVFDVDEGEQRKGLSDSLEHETGGFPDNSDILHSGTSLEIRDSQEGHIKSVTRGSSVMNDGKNDLRKGKEKVLEAEESTAKVLDEETTAVVCGICWTEMGVVERGKLDSCNHFFCFGCIMEWAKVESRCPMCKQRFTTIARSGTGITKRTRAIRIPLRNQVYIPPEDPDLPLEDPYADIVCMECQGTGDEGLLLLCDRCDSAAHTFCVGLGRSVPRGDWYCRECQALTGEMSSSDTEPELVLDDEDDDDDDEENEERQSLLRSIVASVNPGSRRNRQTIAQRRLTSASSPPPLQRNRRRRLERRLSRRHRGRHIAAPRLSQAARALLSSTSSEPNNQASRAPEALQNGSARTVPQQRRLHERINEMRNNWGRIQNGDLHFDALRSGATRPMPPAVSSDSNGAASRGAILSNSNGAASRGGARDITQEAAMHIPNIAPVAPTPSIMPPVSSDNRDESLEQPDSSIRGIKDVERAWRMMGQAQNLGIGSSKSHQQKLGASSLLSVLGRAKPPTEITASSPTSSLSFARKNSGISTSQPLRNGNTGSYKLESTPVQAFSNLKHDEIPLQRVPMPIAPLALTEECKKEDLPSSSNSKLSLGWKNTGNFASTQGFKPELSNSGEQFERKDASITHTGIGNPRRADNRDGSAARENIVAGSLSSPPREGLKVHLTELVKKQTWPVYITERLDKEQFKRIARAAVHSLLALCDPSNKSVSLSCVHFEDQGIDPVVKCCNKCLDQHVEKAVKNAKDKIIPS